MDNVQRIPVSSLVLVDSALGDMKVALFLPSLRGGGAERVMVSLANGLAAQGWRVDLVVGNACGTYLKHVAPDVTVIDLQASRVLYSLPALVRYLRRSRPTVMLSALNHANIIALWACKLAGVNTRVVISEHNNLTRDMHSESTWRLRLIPLLMRCCYSKAHAIVAVSNGVADDLAKVLALPRERLDVIYNPVVTEQLHELSARTVIHPWLAIGEPPVILAVGRLTEQKDYPTLINAFAALRARQAARLVILGEGELRERLEAMAESLGLSADLLFLGFVDNPYAWMRQASLFVLSSAWEGLPTVLVEAMACGTPVISTDCPSGPAEILENGAWGQLVPVGNPEMLCEAMAAGLSGEPGPDVERRAQQFDLDQAVKAYLHVMQRQPI